MPARPLEQQAALVYVESAKWLVQNDQPDVRAQQSARQADSLSFSARDQAAAFTERSLERIGKPLEHAAQVGGIYGLLDRHARAVGEAVFEIVEQRPIPKLDRRIDPGDMG